MAKIIGGATMSLDGYIAGPEESGFDRLFQCYGNGGQMAKQALQAGLLDEIGVDLVPVRLGGGTPFFDALGAPVDPEGPTSTVQGKAVTHLRYRVVRQ